MKALTKTLLSRPEIAAVVVAVVLAVGLGFNAERFLTEGNWRVILTIVPELGLIALGVTVLMISGEFDLSVGSVFALGGTVPVILTARLGVDPRLDRFRHRHGSGPDHWLFQRVCDAHLPHPLLEGRQRLATSRASSEIEGFGPRRFAGGRSAVACCRDFMA